MIKQPQTKSALYASNAKKTKKNSNTKHRTTPRTQTTPRHPGLSLPEPAASRPRGLAASRPGGLRRARGPALLLEMVFSSSKTSEVTLAPCWPRFGQIAPDRIPGRAGEAKSREGISTKENSFFFFKKNKSLSKKRFLEQFGFPSCFLLAVGQVFWHMFGSFVGCEGDLFWRSGKLPIGH